MKESIFFILTACGVLLKIIKVTLDNETLIPIMCMSGYGVRTV